MDSNKTLDFASGSGNVYVTGYTYGNLDGNTSNGLYDIFITKYSNP